MKFNQITKQLRLNLRLTLRQFCLNAQLDPSNWSKVERGVIPPPKDQETLDRIIKTLNITNSERQAFIDAAFAARAEIPDDIAGDERLVAQLPAFFHTLRGSELSREKMDELIADVRKINSP